MENEIRKYLDEEGLAIGSILGAMVGELPPKNSLPRVT